MNPEEKTENFNADNASDPLEEIQSAENTATYASAQDDSREIDNFPVESIGSYARLDELLTDEEAENTNNPTTQS
jgi:hypothetical protein